MNSGYSLTNFPMKLLRIVTAIFSPDPNLGKSWSIQLGDVEVSTMKLIKENNLAWTTLLIAEMEIEFPAISSDGHVCIPEKERRELEFSLETISNLVSVFGKCKKTLSSAMPSVALVPENNNELGILNATKGMFYKRKTTINPITSNQLDTDLLNHLQDRLRAVALLSEAHSHSLEAGKFHEYIRLFEYAFALQFSQIQRKLLQFLDPVYGYTAEEIKAWISIRDPLTHADGKKTQEILLDSDVRPYTKRMEQAAYDVLFNKNNWHNRSRERRNVWKPKAITSSPTGDMIIERGSELKLVGQLFDEFDVYPVNLGAVIKDLPHGWWSKMDYQNSE